MKFGRMVHCCILESNVFYSKYIRIDDVGICEELLNGGVKNPRSTKGYRIWLEEFKQDNVDKEIVPLDDYNKAVAISNAVFSHSYASKLLDGIEAEKSIFFTDPETGAMCKARPDGINTTSIETPIILELKTCENASPEAFGRSAFNLGYHNQAAFYVDGYNIVFGKKPLHVFIAVEREPPYACALYYTPDEVLYMGSRENAADLRKYVDSLSTGAWKGYDETVTPLQFPAWAIR